MKKLIAITLLFMPLLAQADPAGFYLGAGAAATVNNDCSYCDTSGVAVAAGYDLGRVFGVDATVLSTEFDNSNAEVTTIYAGLNAGPDFGSRWVKIYGKVGVYSATQSAPGYHDMSDTNVAFGAGVRVTPWGHQSKVFFKLDVLSSTFYDESVVASTLTVGYKF